MSEHAHHLHVSGFPPTSSHVHLEPPPPLSSPFNSLNLIADRSCQSTDTKMVLMYTKLTSAGNRQILNLLPPETCSHRRYERGCASLASQVSLRRQVTSTSDRHYHLHSIVIKLLFTHPQRTNRKYSSSMKFSIVVIVSLLTKTGLSIEPSVSLLRGMANEAIAWIASLACLHGVTPWFVSAQRRMYHTSTHLHNFNSQFSTCAYPCDNSSLFSSISRVSEPRRPRSINTRDVQLALTTLWDANGPSSRPMTSRPPSLALAWTLPIYNPRTRVACRRSLMPTGPPSQQSRTVKKLSNALMAMLTRHA